MNASEDQYRGHERYGHQVQRLVEAIRARSFGTILRSYGEDMGQAFGLIVRGNALALEAETEAEFDRGNDVIARGDDLLEHVRDSVIFFECEV